MCVVQNGELFHVLSVVWCVLEGFKLILFRVLFAVCSGLSGVFGMV